MFGLLVGIEMGRDILAENVKTTDLLRGKRNTTIGVPDADMMNLRLQRYCFTKLNLELIMALKWLTILQQARSAQIAFG